ncbi:3-oxoacyl-ACP reductase [Bordetella genomosp. 9]|uniref:3-oxoacyl-ACP reductase n=1 Tax=Bordetella genomosp. 9 TaxID=1416803 RepID=A0A261R7B2_9BORD|nr:SDR family NAD(P)-dependent oxidoreductase [Bordetella genomosp. 9]OZI20490.1 3-oxoacyl-ACP reductase [Bordetella genomosp. 9]
MDLNLSGKKALITGSSRGIGEAIARKLALEKATVIVHGRDAAQVDKVANEITALGGCAHAVVGDLTHDDQAQRLIEAAQKLVGSIDILINNAGGSGGAKESWLDTQPASWASAYDRNVLAALRVTTRLLPRMQKAKWGRVINISSLAATMPSPTAPGYSACKAAINAMTASMAKAVAADGVTVNAISPGTIHSSTLDARFREVAEERGLCSKDAPWEEIERHVLPLFAQVPVGRVGQLEEIAAAVAFLASPVAGYITGTNLRVDGGLSPVL